MSGMPSISIAIVLNHDADGGGMQVALRTSGDSPSLPVRMMRHGPSDGLRISQRPMPSPGSWGLVSFPYGDPRNGIWLGSFSPNFIDAITSNSDNFDPYLDYESHFSGFWKLLDGKGNASTSYPDGSYFVQNEAGALADTFRHMVDENQKRQRIPFTTADRISEVPSPRVSRFHHASGTDMAIDATGDVTVTAANGKTITVQANGATLKLDATGVITLSSSSAVNITSQTNIGIAAPEVTANSGGISLQLLNENALSRYNGHTHPAPGGTTGVPNQQMVPGTDSTSTFKAQ